MFPFFLFKKNPERLIHIHDNNIVRGHLQQGLQKSPNPTITTKRFEKALCPIKKRRRKKEHGANFRNKKIHSPLHPDPSP